MLKNVNFLVQTEPIDINHVNTDSILEQNAYPVRKNNFKHFLCYVNSSNDNIEPYLLNFQN